MTAHAATALAGMLLAWLSLVAPAVPAGGYDVACSGTCTVNASASLLAAPGYDPAALVMENATEVVWHSADPTTHIHAELGADSNCVDAVSSFGTDSDPVLFEIWQGVLRATQGETTTTCTSAHGDADVGFVLHYRCTIHPNMNGALVVLA